MTTVLVPEPTVLGEDRDGYRLLTLLRPGHANAVSADLVERLHTEVDSAERDQVRVLVLQGNDRHFSAGFDLGDLEDETDASLLHRFVRFGLLLERLHTAPFVTVAVVAGAAVGAGADLVAACDHRLAGPEATFRFPGARFGAVLGTGRLAALVGPGAALRTVTGGARLDAQDAYALGLVDEVAELADLYAAAARIAVEMATLPTGTGRRLLNVTRDPARSNDLGDLVRSLASEPGLKDRIVAHAALSLPTPPDAVGRNPTS